jgi:hypothetical protein
VLKPLVDTEEELAALAGIEGATSSRRVAQDRGAESLANEEFVYNIPHAHFINAAFAYAKPRAPNRFNAERGAWYSSAEVEKSIAEVSFHLSRFLEDSGSFEGTFDYAEL